VGPRIAGRLWKRSHNEIHHTYTNVLGRDNDLGYGIMRVDEDQRWVPMFLSQPLWNFINACFFEYAMAAYDLGSLSACSQPESRSNKMATCDTATRLRVSYVTNMGETRSPENPEPMTAAERMRGTEPGSLATTYPK